MWLDGVTVLWDSAFDGMRVRGLHELLLPAQVKKGNVRVIAQVHPDKVGFRPFGFIGFICSCFPFFLHSPFGRSIVCLPDFLHIIPPILWLNSTNSTVEQRMLANGVFDTLNKVWITFQDKKK